MPDSHEYPSQSDGDSTGVLHYDQVQNLDEASKEQARNNAGAASADEFTKLSGRVNDKSDYHAYQSATYYENVLRNVTPMEEIYVAPSGRVLGHNAIIWDAVRGRLAAYFCEGNLPLNDEPSEHGVKVSYSTDGKVGQSWTSPTTVIPVESGWNGVRDLGVNMINGVIYLQTSQANDNLTDHDVAVYRSMDGETFTKQGSIPLVAGKNRGYVKTFLAVDKNILAFGWQASQLNTASYNSYVWQSEDNGKTWTVLHDLGVGNETTAIRFKGKVYAFVRGLNSLHAVDLGVNAESIVSSVDISSNIPNFHPKHASLSNINDFYLAIGYRNNYDGKIQHALALTDLDSVWKSHLLAGRNYGQAMISLGDNSFSVLGTETPLYKIDGSGIAAGADENMRLVYGAVRAGGSVGMLGQVGVGRRAQAPKGVLVWENNEVLTGQPTVIVGSPQSVRGDYFGDSVREYGEGDADKVGVNSDFNFLHDGSPFTLGVWVKRSSIPSGKSGRILCSGVSGDDVGILLRWEKTGGDIIRFYVHNGSGAEAVNVGVGAPRIGSEQNPEDWVMYLIRYDGTSYHVQLGVNQVLAHFKPMSGAAGVGNAENALHIGGWTSGHPSEPDALQIGRVFIDDAFLTGAKLTEVVRFLEGGI